MDDTSARLPHEPSRVSLRAIGVGVGIMAGGIVVALGGAWAVSRFVPSPLNAPNDARPPRIEGPVQRTAPSLELDAFLREKRARLQGSGRDPRSGEAFMPIEEAMQAMAKDARANSGGGGR